MDKDNLYLGFSVTDIGCGLMEDERALPFQSSPNRPLRFTSITAARGSASTYFASRLNYKMDKLFFKPNEARVVHFRFILR